MNDHIPICRYRSNHKKPDRFMCRSSCVVMHDRSKGIPKLLCTLCPYPDEECSPMVMSVVPRKSLEFPTSGLGELFHLLIVQVTGQQPSAGCKCSSRMTMMNRWGLMGCWQNRQAIYSWLREEAANRGVQCEATFVSLFTTAVNQWNQRYPDRRVDNVQEMLDSAKKNFPAIKGLVGDLVQSERQAAKDKQPSPLLAFIQPYIDAERKAAEEDKPSEISQLLDAIEVNL